MKAPLTCGRSATLRMMQGVVMWNPPGREPTSLGGRENELRRDSPNGLKGGKGQVEVGKGEGNLGPPERGGVKIRPQDQTTQWKKAVHK